MKQAEIRSFDHALHSAHSWVNAVAAQFGTEDRDFAFRVLRAWLHAVRDELPVAESAHFAAQLPDLLRGVYYEGWNPAVVPRRLQLADVVRRFAVEANVSETDVPKIAWSISDVIDQHLTNLQKTLDRIRQDVRALFAPSG